MKILLSSVALVTMAVSAFADEVMLVADHVAKAAIVLPADAKPWEKTAAEELSKWTKVVTGAELAVGTAPVAGLTPIRFARQADGVTGDGFAIEASPEAITISAHATEGPLFAVFWLLNRFAGLYFFHPDSGADFAPRADFAIPAGLTVRNPMRERFGVHAGNGALATPERRLRTGWWNMRNGFALDFLAYPRGEKDDETGPGNFYPNGFMTQLGSEGHWIGGGHMTGALILSSEVDPKEYAEALAETKEHAQELFQRKNNLDELCKWYARWKVLVKHHPDWFGLVDGVRVPCSVYLRQGDTLIGPSAMPCLSNPEVRETMFRNFKRWQAERYGEEPFTWRMLCDDQSRWCECDNCMKLLKNKGPSDDKDKASDYWWDFVNWFSERALKDPKISIVAEVYRTYQDFPKRVRPVARERMSVRLALHGRCYMHALTDAKCPLNGRYRKMIEDWSAAGMPVETSEFMCQAPGKCNYAFFERAWIDDVRWYCRHNVSHAGENLVGPWDAFSTDDGYFRRNCAKARWLLAYLTGHFEWDPGDDFDTVRDTALRLYYRAAAKPMTAYHKLLEQALLATGQCMGYGGGGTLFTAAAFQPGVMANAKALLEEARALAKDDPELQKRLAMDEEYFRADWESSAISSDAAVALERAEGPIAADGVLSEPDWTRARAFREFLHVAYVGDTPNKATTPYPLATTARLAYDDANLYLAFECRKENGQVLDVPPTGDAFSAMKGSHLEVCLLPPNLGGKYYHLAFSHDGELYSALTTNGKERDLAKTLDVKWAVRDTPESWTVEAAIPLAPFGGVRAGDCWKVQMDRTDVDGRGKRIRGGGNLSGYPFSSVEYWPVVSFGAAANLLSNGSFEDLVPVSSVVGTGSGKLNGKNWTFRSAKIPAKWFYQQNGGIAESGKVKVGGEGEGGGEGRMSSFIHVEGKTPTAQAFLWQDLLPYSTETTALTLTFRARGKGTLGVLPTLNRQQAPRASQAVDTADWKAYSLPIPLGGVHATRVLLDVTGRIDLDDVVLEAASGAHDGH